MHERVERGDRGAGERGGDGEPDHLERLQVHRARDGDLHVGRPREVRGANRRGGRPRGAAHAYPFQVVVGGGARVTGGAGPVAGQRGGPRGVAGRGADLPGRAHPVAAGRDEQEQHEEPGDRDGELDRHRAALLSPGGATPRTPRLPSAALRRRRLPLRAPRLPSAALRRPGLTLRAPPHPQPPPAATGWKHSCGPCTVTVTVIPPNISSRLSRWPETVTPAIATLPAWAPVVKGVAVTFVSIFVPRPL